MHAFLGVFTAMSVQAAEGVHGKQHPAAFLLLLLLLPAMIVSSKTSIVAHLASPQSQQAYYLAAVGIRMIGWHQDVLITHPICKLTCICLCIDCRQSVRSSSDPRNIHVACIHKDLPALVLCPLYTLQQNGC